ncbi:MAG TPA: hypothetical protein DCE78_02600 [Bacteroidetes bacterium]|nr:hypothetical protein [Bacteroidota bacterium]
MLILLSFGMFIGQISANSRYEIPSFRTINSVTTNSIVDLITNEFSTLPGTTTTSTSSNLSADTTANGTANPAGQHQFHADHYIRCLTPLIAEYEDNPDSRAELGPILGINSLEELHQKHSNAAEIANYEEHLSESGRFLIRFKRTGTGAVSDVDEDENGIPDYVDIAATSADSSWNYLVGHIGFNDPVPDLEKPLIIRIDKLSGSFYGQYRNSTRTIDVQNSYDGFPPNKDPDNQGLGALKVTIAHELKHAIQYVTFVSSSDVSSGWMELDATMAEEVVYPTVKDYLNYLRSNQNPSIFLNPQRVIPENPFGYYHVTAGLFYREKFGEDFWVRVWERIENRESTGIADYMHQAISQELISRGFSPDAEFVNLYLWHYAAGTTNSRTDFGFKDKLLYPDIRLSNTDLNRSMPYKSPTNTFNWKAAYVYEFYPDADLPLDDNIMVGLFRSPKFPNFDGRVHVGLIAYFENGSIETVTIDLSQDTELISFYGDDFGFIGSHVDWNLDEIEKIGVVLANTTPQRQSQATSTLPRAQLVIGTSSNPSTSKFGEIISNALEEAQAEALLDRLVGRIGAPSINTPVDFISADVSGNQKLSAYDASLILQKSGQLISAYPVDPENLAYAPLPSWYTIITPPLASVHVSDQCFSNCFSYDEITDDPEITFDAIFGDPDNEEDHTLRVRLSVNTNSSFNSGFVEVDFDSTFLHFVNYDISGSNQDMIKSFHHDTLSSGHIKLAFASSEIAFDSESILTLNFRPKPIVRELTNVTLTMTKLELDEQFVLTPNLSDSSWVISNEPVSIERPTEIPITTELHPVYPNPFNPTTTIPFSISARQNVTIQIYDLTGRLISTISNEIYAPGSHSVRFNAVNLSSGIYIARMIVSDPAGFSPTEMFIQRLTLIK